MANHAEGECFVLLSEALFALDQSIEAIGSTIRVRLVAPNRSFAESPEALHRIEGRSLRPLAPVHLGGKLLQNGDIAISWIRRSRSGFGWVDGAEAPLAEDREMYRLLCSAGDGTFEAEADASPFLLSPAQQLSSFGSLPDEVRIEVAQVSGAVGAGDVASCNVVLNR